MVGPPEEHSEDYARPSRFSPVSFLAGLTAGTFLGVALALAAVVLVSEEDSPRRAASTTPVPGVAAPARATATATSEARARARTQLDVRLGPGNAYAVIGLLNRGEAVTPIGRDGDSAWVAIQFPPGSTGRGWVPVSALENLSGLDRLAIVLPTPLPRTVSTPVLRFADNGPSTGGDGEAGVTPTATPPPSGQPDLVVTSIRLLPDGRVAVTIGNRGTGAVVGQSIFVHVRNLAARSEQLVTPPGTLRPGGTVTVETQIFHVEGEEEIVAIVDPFAGIPEADRSNNTLRVVLAVSRTPTPQPRTLP